MRANRSGSAFGHTPNLVGLDGLPPALHPPMTRDQKRSLFLHTEIVKELRSRETEVIEIARRNVSHMRSVNPRAAPLLDEWERILQGTTDYIAERVLDSSLRGRDLRQVTPFAGVLTSAQRFNTYRSFRKAWNEQSRV